MREVLGSSPGRAMSFSSPVTHPLIPLYRECPPPRAWPLLHPTLQTAVLYAIVNRSSTALSDKQLGFINIFILVSVLLCPILFLCRTIGHFSRSLYYMSEQRRLWRDSEDAQACLSLCCSPMQCDRNAFHISWLKRFTTPN